MKHSFDEVSTTGAGQKTIASNVRTRLTAAAVVGTVALGLWSGGAAVAVEVTPDSGPTSGGTTVDLSIEGAKFTQVFGDGTSGAVASDGQVYTWGAYSGNGTSDVVAVPSPITPPPGVTFVKYDGFGSDGTFAQGDDGNWYYWGVAIFHPTGTSDTGPFLIPTLVQPPAGVTYTDLHGGNGTVHAIGDDGNLYGWGYNTYGQVGTGATSPSNIESPTLIVPPAGVTFVDVESTITSTIALGDDGVAYAWGRQSAGALGNGSGSNASRLSIAPVTMPAGVLFTEIYGSTSGPFFARGDDGNYYAWGNNTSGQIGDGSTTNRLVPTLTLVGAPEFSKLVLDSPRSFGLGLDGITYAWGSGTSGGLGTGTTSNSATPVMMDMPDGVTFVDLAAFTFVAAAVGDDGHLYTWGSGLGPSLGNGVDLGDNVLSPTAISQWDVTQVLFDGVAGTGLARNSETDFSVATPASTVCGPVATTASWTQFGASNDVTTPNGFTYLVAAPVTVVSDPASTTITAGESTTLTSTATGDPAPSVRWQSSTDGATWTDLGISTSSAAVNPAQDTQYRAVFDACETSVTSAVAEVTVMDAVVPTDPSGPTEEPTATPTGTQGSGLAVTGGSAPEALWIAAGVLTALGGLLILMTRRRRANQ